MSMTLSICSWPAIDLWRPGTARAPCSRRVSAGWRMPFTSVDLPAPDTPVTATKQESGKETVTSFRLFSVAPTTVMRPLPMGRRRGGTEISARPDR